MKKPASICVIISLALVLTVAGAEAASVYLKNGRVIENVSAYKKVDGKYQFQVGGGIMEVPASDVLRIVERAEEPPAEQVIEQVIEPAQEPAQKPAAPVKEDGQMKARKVSELQRRIKELDERLAEMKKLEDEDADLKKQYEEVGLRIEVLFQKGRKAAQAAGKDISVWFQFLTPQEREWIQINTFKKKEIEDKMKKLKDDLELKLSDKADVLEEKRLLEDELSRLQ